VPNLVNSFYADVVSKTWYLIDGDGDFRERGEGEGAPAWVYGMSLYQDNRSD
jgi:hypothetical protein